MTYKVCVVTLSVLLAVAQATPLSAQGAIAPLGITLLDNNGNPCSGCVLHSFAAGTSTPLATFADASLSTSNGTSVTLDATGRASVFLDSRLAYLLTLRTPTGTDIWTRDGITGPLSGVISAQGADTRGIQVSRSSADAGISIASVGGSGKTYGLVSDTAGGFTIRDDSDGTPNMQWLGNNITATLTGTFTVSGGLLSVTGYGDHIFSASGNGPNRLGIRNTSSGTAAVASFMLGNDAAVNVGALFALSSGYSTTGSYVADGVSVEATRSGGLSLNASNAAGDIRMYAGGNATPRLTLSDTGVTTITTLTPGILNTGTAQPGFLAYNSSSDANVTAAAAIDFDTEVYDLTSSFAADTFTAPVTGVYHFCTGVEVTGDITDTVAAEEVYISLVASNRTLDLPGGLDSGATPETTTVRIGGCVYVDMDAADTAFIRGNWTTGSGDATVSGGASPHPTWFSGRLVP